MSTITTAATARLEARISTDLHAMLKRAAEIQGRTMTDFVVSAVQDAASAPSNRSMSFACRASIKSALRARCWRRRLQRQP
jgi:uncharacterized protein (DUF1778 family)